MTFSEILTGVIGAITILLVLAQLKEDQRAWAARRGGQALAVLFVVLAIGNSLVGIYYFAVHPSAPTRADILVLLLHAFNLVAIPKLALDTLLDARRAARLKAQLKVESVLLPKA